MEYKGIRRKTKKEVLAAKQKAYEELYARLYSKERVKGLYRLAKQKNRAGKDIQVKVMNNKHGNILTGEESVLK